MELPPADFESAASTSFTTSANLIFETLIRLRNLVVFYILALGPGHNFTHFVLDFGPVFYYALAFFYIPSANVEILAYVSRLQITYRQLAGKSDCFQVLVDGYHCFIKQGRNNARMYYVWRTFQQFMCGVLTKGCFCIIVKFQLQFQTLLVVLAAAETNFIFEFNHAAFLEYNDPFVKNFINLYRLLLFKPLHDQINFILIEPFIHVGRKHIRFHEVHLKGHDKIFLRQSSQCYQNFSDETCFVVLL